MSAKDGREDRTVRVRLNIAKPDEHDVHLFLKSLTSGRKLKGFILDAIAIARAYRAGDYPALMLLLPDFAQWLRAETMRDVQSPVNAEFERLIVKDEFAPEPLDTLPDDEPAEFDDDELDMFEF